LIRRAAEVLIASTGSRYITARIGGDEFIVIMPGANMDSAHELMERIQSLVVMNNKFYRDPELSLSLGAAVSEPGLPLEKTISNADNEMYKNKGLYHRRRKDDFFNRIEQE
jgi:diguanylate cyclase (GGDEF)-like protein